MKVISNQFLGGTMYAPFCRTLSADKKEWPSDFANMKALGFNCVHGFAEWHDVEYKKGVFDFSAVDSMIECATANGIVPIINIATQNSVGFYSPRWLMKECEGGEYVDAAGQKTENCLYTVPCLDNPTYKFYSDRYLNEVGRHFAGDTRVGGYVLWGEPGLFRAGSTSPICFCEHTLKRFRDWLKEKYKTIDALNRVWATEGPADFEDFYEVKPPRGFGRQLGGYASWVDWRNFICDNFCYHIGNADRILKQNGATQPTIVEMDYNLGREWVCDQWKIAACADMIGLSSFQRPGRGVSNVMWAADSMAKAQGKSVFVVEIPGGSVSFAEYPTSPSYTEVQSAMIQRAVNGAKGAMYWCYRPRMSDTEGGDFGLVTKSGRVTYKAVSGGEITQILTRNSELLNRLTRRSEVAIYVSSEINNLILAENISGVYKNELLGVQRLLEDLHINGDFVNEGYIKNIHKYKVLILPFAFIITEKVVKEIEEFVKNGGVVIADYMVGYKKPNGVCYYDMKESGLERIFGIEEIDPMLYKNKAPVREYGLSHGSRICYPYRTSAEVIKEHEGTTILTSHACGKGRGLYVAGPIFHEYAQGYDSSIRSTVKRLLKEAGIDSEIALKVNDSLKESPLITSQMSGDKGERLYSVLNETEEEVSDTLILPRGEYVDLNGKEYPATQDGEKVAIDIKLDPMQTLVFIKK